MGYVENIAAFIEYAEKFNPGVHVYNFIDKPDYTMNELVKKVKGIVGHPKVIGVRLPYWLEFTAGKAFDLFTGLTGESV